MRRMCCAKRTGWSPAPMARASWTRARATSDETHEPPSRARQRADPAGRGRLSDRRRPRPTNRIRHRDRRGRLVRSVSRQWARERQGDGRGEGEFARGSGKRRAVSACPAFERAPPADESRAAFSSRPWHRTRATHRSGAEGAQGAGRLIGGIVLVAKPAGPTSHDVVDTVRRMLGEQRVGHLGTLDPFAKGLLVLVVGRATRLATFAAGWAKSYERGIPVGGPARNQETDRT